MHTTMEVTHLVTLTGPVCVQASTVGLVAAGQEATPGVPSAAPTSSAQPEEREQGFKPDQGGADLQSGELLLIEAYAAIWLVAFGLILHTWRKQRQLAARLDQLGRDIARERDGRDGDRNSSPTSE